MANNPNDNLIMENLTVQQKADLERCKRSKKGERDCMNCSCTDGNVDDCMHNHIHPPYLIGNPDLYTIEGLVIDTVTNFHGMLMILPLEYYTPRRKIKIGEDRTLRKFFNDIDESLHNYLGINQATDEESLQAEVSRLLEKEEDLQHKYYLIHTDCGSPVGIFYVYDYRQKWGKTKIGCGLLPEYRGKGIMTDVLKAVIDVLENENGICRIEGEVETTNTASLKLCEKLSKELGFEYEGIRKNN